MNFSAADHAARSFNESGSRLVCKQYKTLQTSQPLSRSPKGATTPLLAAPVWLSKGFLKVPGKSMCIQSHHVTVSGKRPMVSGSRLLSKRLFERKLPNDCTKASQNWIESFIEVFHQHYILGHSNYVRVCLKSFRPQFGSTISTLLSIYWPVEVGP